jgi:hypothetical protein
MLPHSVVFFMNSPDARTREPDITRRIQSMMNTSGKNNGKDSEEVREQLHDLSSMECIGVESCSRKNELCNKQRNYVIQ